jgi:hypothetical protein
MMKSRKKQPSWKRGTKQKKTSTTLEFIPAASCSNSGTSLGDSVVELATSKGTINQPRERIKTD